ncbi:hypothetical protein [Okeania sp. SIO2B3]|nr:hypothetical protein [Okeania sp. SIO2B3]
MLTWLTTELFLNFTGLDEVADYSEYIIHINHQHIEAIELSTVFV